MMNYNNLCMNCMNPLFPNETRCSKCGHDRSAAQNPPCLALRTVLKQSYLVGTVTSKSNAVISYNGFDCVSGKRICIHEYFPQKLASRSPDGNQVITDQRYSGLYYECLNAFDELWKSMMTLRMYDALETPYDVFYLNNTVYCVTDYKQCITLRQYLDSDGQLLTWTQASESFFPVFDALSALHESGRIHGSISISSVLIGADNKIHLTLPAVPQDFYSVPEVEPVLQDGYSPLECYDKSYGLSVQTDMYSVMAVMYVAMTGVSPQKATDRVLSDTMIIPHSLASGMTSQAIETLIGSMKVYPYERFGSIPELKERIKASLVPEPAVVAGYSPPVSAPQAAASPNVPPATVQPKTRQNTAPKAPDGERDSKKSIIIKAVISAVVIAFVVFSTLYTTSLYKSISVPFLDKLYAPLSFLPINQENDHGPTVAQTTTVPPTVTPTTAAPVVTVPPTVAPTTTTEPPTTAAPTTTEPPTTPAPTTTAPTTQAIRPGEGVEVADFTKLTYSDIRANAVFNKNFTFEYQFESSDTYEKNAVISQSIPAGETVEKGTKIVLVISTGPEKVELPDVIGMDYEQAKMTLENKGFKVKKEIRENDGNETPGKVYMMSLVAGLEFEKGTEVTLVVWGDRP